MKLSHWFIVASIFLSFAATGFTQEKETFGFQPEAVLGVNITQNRYSNWTGGGENAHSYTLTLKSALVSNRPKYQWKVTGDFAFGQTKVGKEPLRNAVDRIDVNGLFTYKWWASLNPYISIGLLTQFATGYDYSKSPKLAKSAFFDPAYITADGGMEWGIRRKVTTRLGFGLKYTVTDKYWQFKYADRASTPDVIEKTKLEGGIHSVTELEAKLANNLLYTSKLGLFSSFADVTAVDVKFDNTWTAKVAKYLSVNLILNLFYDRDVSDRLQVQEILAIGLTYTLGA